MACGPRPHNPSELLSSEEFADVLHVLRERFDFVIVDTAKSPKNYDVVVALVDGQNTLKRYVLDNGTARLYPDSTNPAHSEIIPLNEASVQGVVTASFRHY